MVTNNILDAVNSNFLNANFCYPINSLVDYSSKYFSNRNYNVDSKGIIEARKSILKYYHLNSNQVDNIFITASTSESYLNILSNIANEGEVLFPNPSYPLFEYLSKYSNTKYKYYNLLNENNNFDLESLRLSITSNTKAIVVISPNNPMGTVLSKIELKEIIKICKEFKFKLILDTVFDIFNYSSSQIISPQDITEEVEIFWLNGISKMFALPDLKIAWIYYQNPSEKLLDELETFNDTFLNANYLSQNILPYLFENSATFQKEMISYLQKNIHIANGIDKNGFIYSLPKGGIHFTCALKNFHEKFKTDLQLSEYLEKKFRLHTHPLSFYEYNSKSPSVVMTILHTETNMKEIVSRLNEFSNECL